MGVVYEGFDPKIGRRVAIKTARRDVLEGSGYAEEMMARFLREARAAGALNHPGIITIYDVGEEGGTAYIAMEYIPTGSLQDRMEAKVRLDPSEVVRIGAMICDALAAAHDEGIVHRDIKPANVMMLADGAVKLADFGIARITNSNLTQDGAMVGTPHFMSPEQFMGQKVDARSDLFSVGLILYEMLTGEKPFGGDTFSAVMHRVIKAEPIEPNELNLAVNDCLSRVVMKALSKNPNRRYANGRTMAAALRESLAENPNPAITGVPPAGASPDATIPARQQEATVVSTSLPDAIGARRPGTPPPEPPPAIAVPGKASRERRRTVPASVIGGLVALVMLAIATALFLAGRGHAPGAREGGAPPPGDTPPSFSVLNVKVWFATPEAWRAASDADENSTDQDYERWGCTPGSADIVITDLDGKRTIDKRQDVDTPIDLVTPCGHVHVEYSQQGYLPTSREYTATKPGDVIRGNVVLKKEQ
jgi:serine/threonine-protein kinase